MGTRKTEGTRKPGTDSPGSTAPTLSDVMTAVNQLAHKVDGRLDQMEQRLTRLEENALAREIRRQFRVPTRPAREDLPAGTWGPAYGAGAPRGAANLLGDGDLDYVPPRTKRY